MEDSAGIDKEAVRAANPMVDVAARYTTLNRKGRTFRGLCPIHQERHPSFVVYPPDRWWCYGCERGGDVFDFVQEVEHLTFKEALQFLAEGKLPTHKVPTPKEWLEVPPPFGNTPLGEKEYHLLEEVTAFYHLALFANPFALKYVEGRAISRSTIERFRVGYAPGDRLARFLTFKGWDLQLAHDVGLLTPRGAFFQGRVIVPEMDERGRVIHLSGRDIRGQEPKYLFMAGVSKPVYGLPKLQVGRPVFVVEGAFDWLTLLQWGYQALCLLGLHLNREDAHRLCQARRIYLALDNDEAGQRASEELASRLGRVTEVRVIRFPQSVKDASHLAQRSDGREIFAHLVRRAVAVAHKGERSETW